MVAVENEFYTDKQFRIYVFKLCLSILLKVISSGKGNCLELSSVVADTFERKTKSFDTVS